MQQPYIFDFKWRILTWEHLTPRKLTTAHMQTLKRYNAQTKLPYNKAETLVVDLITKVSITLWNSEGQLSISSFNKQQLLK